MGVLITYGALALFFIVVVVVLQRSYVADRNFSDFAVAGRSFGGFFQAMAFLNTYFPGTVFLGFAGFVTANGVIGMGMSSLLAPIVMYLMAERVWTWGATHDLRTQPDLMRLRFDSRLVGILAALVGILGLMPWMVLGMQSLGAVFQALSLGGLDFATAVALGVAVMSARQVWTVRMGMRGIVISDLFQGLVAYGLGSALIVWLILWLMGNGSTLAEVAPERLALPGRDSPQPLLFFSLVLLPLLSSLCWPDLFVRLYTGSGVRSVKRSAAYCAPIMVVFLGGLYLFALLASTRADALAAPDSAWFTVSLAAGGPVALAIAGVAVFAASMGNIDATVQSCGAQIANDVIRPLRPLSDRGVMVISQIAMAVITLASAAIACLPLPSLFSIGLFAIQIMTQLAVPLYLGIFSRFGHRHGAAGGMVAGIAVVCVLQAMWPVGMPWALGLTSGAIGLVVNLAVYVAAGLLLPRSRAERERVDRLFDHPSATPSPPVASVSGRLA